MTTRTPVNLVTGFLGAGKTSTILSLLAGKPAGETWAVIVNEFGEIGIDGAVLGDRDGLVMREIAGGCLCCVTGPQLTVTVARLIREVRPARQPFPPAPADAADRTGHQRLCLAARSRIRPGPGHSPV